MYTNVYVDIHCLLLFGNGLLLSVPQMGDSGISFCPILDTAPISTSFLTGQVNTLPVCQQFHPQIA